MKTYYVQLTNLNHAIEIYADTNPEAKYDNDQGQFFLILSRNGEVVGRFAVQYVVGWWCVN